jgi:hypothetical protein
MSVRRMKWEVDGRIYAGLLFDSERELEAFLCDRAPISFEVSPPRQTTPAVDGKHAGRRGRPSKQPIIADAVAGLESSSTSAQPSPSAPGSS